MVQLVDLTSYLKRHLSRTIIFIDIDNPDGIQSSARIKQLASLLHKKFGLKEFIGVAWRNGRSDHEKGKALDIIAQSYPFLPKNKDLRTMEQCVSYLLEHRKTHHIAYIIWQNKIAEGPQWQWKDNIADTRHRTASELHLDHIHVSFLRP